MTTGQLGAVLGHLRTLASSPTRESSDGQLLERFQRQRDQTAFTALVQRYGRLVWGVCRNVLHHDQDAEDAFQATFLALVRRAGAVRKPESLGSWLHGVAYRVAMKAKRAAGRRRVHEKMRYLGAHAHGSPHAAGSPTSEFAWRELQAALDEEVQALPERLRVPFVLCCLEGRAQNDVAAQLGCKLSTVSSWLTRARKELLRRLARRGVSLTAALAAAVLSQETACAAPPALLAQSTVCAALAFARGATVPAHVAALVKGASKNMFLGKVEIATAIVLTAVVVSAAYGLVRTPISGDDTKAAVQKSTEHPANAKLQAEEDNKGAQTYRGRVISLDGRPVAGAKLYLQSPWQARPVLPPAKLQATTGEDGRFQFRAKPHAPNMLGLLVATVDGHGPAWVPADPKEELTITLAKDDVPISGQVVDLQGRPVAGATVRVLHVQTSNNSPKHDDLTPFLKAAKSHKDNLNPRGPEYQSYLMFLRSEEIPALPQSTRTDADGRFHLRGIGRERMVGVAIEGPSIATQEVRILTRAPLAPGGLDEVRGAAAELGGMIYFFATFTHAAAPTQPITGTVRAKDTHKPISGVRIWSLSPSYSYLGRSLVSTTTDAQGRYRLVGAPKGKENQVVAGSTKEPFLSATKPVPAGQGLEPVTVDFELKRGVWVEGRVVDKVTGKPVSHVRIGYVAFEDNPHVRDAPPLLGPPLASGAESAENGAYRILALPGPGMILTHTTDPTNPYLSEPERDGGLRDGYLKTRPTFEIPGNYNLMTRIDPKDGTELLKLDLPLDPGETRRGTVFDPAGESLCGTMASGLSPWAPFEPQSRKSAEFTLRAFNPRRPRPVLFLHEARKLIGVLEVPKDAATPMTVRLQPACSISGRLVDADGQPRAKVELEVLFLPPKSDVLTPSWPGRVSTDAQGRFQVGGLIAGLEYRLSDRQNEIRIPGLARSGDSKDLGDVQLKPAGD